MSDSLDRVAGFARMDRARTGDAGSVGGWMAGHPDSRIFFFGFASNVLGVRVAAGVLFPFLGILFSPMTAAAAMSFGYVSVILNALRLNRVEL